MVARAAGNMRSARLKAEPPEAEQEPAQEPLGEERLTPGDVQRRALRGTFTLILRGLGIRGLGFLGNLVLARLLVPHDFGLIAFGYTIVAVASYIADGGMASALLRREMPPHRDELRAMVGLQLTSTLALEVLVIAVGVPLGTAGEIAAVMGSALPIDALTTPNSILLERTLRYGTVVRAEVGEVLAYNVFAIAAVALGMGVWGVAFAVIVRALARLVILVTRGPVGLLRPAWAWERVRPLIRFGLQFQSVMFVNLGRDQGINLVTSAIGGLSSLGFWSLAWRLGQAVFLLFESLWRISLPASARLIAAGVDMRPVLERAISRTSLLAGAVVAPLAASGTVLVPLLFGSRWRTTGQIVPLLAISLLIDAPVSACASGYLYAIDRAKFMLAKNTIRALVWLVASAPLLVWIGAPGVGIGSVLSAIVDVLLASFALTRLLRVRLVTPAASPIVTSVIGAALGYALSVRLGTNLVSLFAASALAEAVYVLLMLAFRRRACIDLINMFRRLADEVLQRRRSTAPEPA